MMKLETYRKKLVVFFLLCSLMASTFISCNGGESAVDDTSGSTEDTTVQETEKTINITDQKFSGEEFNIAYMTGGSYGMGNEVDYTFEESQASAITASVYERNLLTEEYLDITINGTFIDPAGGNFNTTILNLVQSGDAQYDAICNYLRYNYQLVQQNALLNIRAIDSFCLENPWWDQGINDAFAFFGSKQFFATGDICFDDDCTIEMLYFSKKLCDDHNLAYPYDDVEAGKWTLDKMVTNMSVVATDLNGDGNMTKEDRWGCGMSIGVVPAMMVYLDAPSTVIDDEGCPQFAYRYQTEKMVNAFETIYNGFISNPAMGFTEKQFGSDYAGVAAMFANNQLLYHGGAIGGLHNLRDTMEDGFGVIPYPKLDESQEEYYSNGAWCASTYAVPVSAENPEQTGAILNVMGYYSVDTITESVIQNVVMLRNTRDEISENMIRIALANKTYDIGLCLALGDYVNKVYGIISSNSNTFVSTMESIQPKFETAIGELIAAYGG